MSDEHIGAIFDKIGIDMDEMELNESVVRCAASPLTLSHCSAGHSHIFPHTWNTLTLRLQTGGASPQFSSLPPPKSNKSDGSTQLELKDTYFKVGGGVRLQKGCWWTLVDTQGGGG